ncbi:MAG TPA: DUF6599 family protein [Thermoanaerobaculia bacterium]|nr:DUF6599 family protein [Thermoanaerobaculia bacterium]
MNEPKQEPSAIESPSMQYFPRDEELAGWRLEDDLSVYPAERLREYLADDSMHFLQYELIDLTAADYIRTRGPGFAIVEVFRFPDFIKAFGAYSTRRTAVVNFLDLGDESFLGPHAIHVWRGPFYIRIIGGGSAGLIDPIKELAAVITEGMPKAPRKPAVFDYLPQNYRIVNSERFVATSVIGKPYLANSFVATFEIGGNRIEGLALPAPSREAASKILAQYRSFYATNGRLLDPIQNLGEENFTGEDRFTGRAVAFRLDRFVIAFSGFADKEKLLELAVDSQTRILRSVRRQLQAE